METQTTKSDWLAERKIGSSDAPSIVGLNPYKSKYKLFLEKTGAIEPDNLDDNESVQWGKILEPVIAEQFANKTKLVVRPNGGNNIYCEQYPFATATPDFYVLENGEIGTLEIKNTSEYNLNDWESGVPNYAHIQKMHQLAITGLKFGYVAGLIGGNKLKYHKVYADPEIIKHLMQQEEIFWQMVIDKTPPELSGDDSELIGKLYPSANKPMIELPSDLEIAAINIKSRKEEIKLLEKMNDVQETLIKDYLKESEGAENENYKITWKNVETTRLDTKLIKEKAPEIYEKYSITSSSRRFLITEKKGK